MSGIDTCRIRAMEFGDLTTVLAWRNHPNVRRHMLTQHEITPEEHERWFVRTSCDRLKKLMIVEEGRRAFGFVQFSGVDAGGIADWGFYIEPGAARGSGRKLGTMALGFAFRDLELHKVCGQALGVNDASIRFHRSHGFQQEGVLRDQRRVDGAYHDLICFGLLRHEWVAGPSGRTEVPT